MSRILRSSIIAVAAALLALAPAAPVASAAPPQRRVVVVRGFGGGFYGPGWYGPVWYGPGWYGPRYAYERNTGQVKIESKNKGESIYIDGGFAGLTGKLKKLRLQAGNHDFEVRDRSGHAFYQERVHVIPGRTVKIYPE